MYLHLTRFVRMLLERKDRISMAVGLEVRVPFCDHRLVEYVYNTPWALKTFDGREKSLLRAAMADLLPASVLQRVKSPYPSTQSPAYSRALMEQAKELVHSDDPVLDLIDRNWLVNISRQNSDEIDIASRNGIERALDLSAWLDIYKPELRLN
jgi:asparagine synthase (glutamine-hydrolysing)